MKHEELEHRCVVCCELLPEERFDKFCVECRADHMRARRKSRPPIDLVPDSEALRTMRNHHFRLTKGDT